MFINIITPCSRPENLKQISESINIPSINYRWIVVLDFVEMPSQDLIPENCEVYLHQNQLSKVGHAQRNFALDLIESGHVYFNDDDTTIHPDLWENIKDLENDFIFFQQLTKEGSVRLSSKEVKVGTVDSHTFIVDKKVIGNIKFDINIYAADGFFAVKCFANSKNPIHIEKPLSVYNKLR